MKRSIQLLLLAVVLLAVSLGSVVQVSAYIVPQSREAAIAEFQEQFKRDGKPTGTYQIDIQYGSGGRLVSETVYMTITDTNTVVSGSVAIDAQDLEVAESQVTMMDAEDWARAAKAHAWRTDTMAVLGVQVDTNQIAKVSGTYPLIFVTDGGVQTSVNVVVTKDIVATLPAVYEDIHTLYINNSTTQLQENVVTDTTFLWGSFGTWIDPVFSGLILIAFLVPITILLIEYTIILQATKRLMQMLKKKE